jgi:hypothetical protein
MMRVVVILLIVLDAFIALGCPPFLLIALAYVKLDAMPGALIALAFTLCWVVAPWGALIVAWRQARRGAGRGRIALILLVPIVAALIGQVLLERLPTRGV